MKLFSCLFIAVFTVWGGMVWWMDIRDVHQADGVAVWQSLFNGKNLDNWERYLGPAFPGHEELEKTATKENVFSIVMLDEIPVIRISGEMHGSLVTKESFENYHLRVVYRWGEQVTLERNSGLLYHSYGPLGTAFGTWMASVECQMMHDNLGDTFLMVDSVECSTRVDSLHNQFVYNSSAQFVDFGQRFHRRMIRKTHNAEKSLGEWNTLELICIWQKAVHVVNGDTVLVNQGICRRTNGVSYPLTSGRLQLQSEGAELFVKEIVVRRL